MDVVKAMFVVLALVIDSSTAQAGDIQAAEDIGEVKAVVDSFEQVWEMEDIELLSRIMAHDSDMVLFGTDPSEHFVGWEAFRSAVSEMFPVLSDTRLDVHDQIIKLDSTGHTAWFSELVDWSFSVDGKPVQQHCRFTGVLEKRNGAWVIVQFHNSVPAG